MKVKILYLFLLLMMACRQQQSNDVVFKTTSEKISFTYLQGGNTFFNVIDQTTRFAMNGAMYQADDYKPVGLYIENRKLVHKAYIVNDNSINFGINPQAVFFIDTNNKAGIIRVQKRDEKKYKYAVQIAPMLLENGTINSALSNFKSKTQRRNGIGVTTNGQVVFILALRKTTLAEFAALFRQNDCINAAYVDGYVSDYWMPGIKSNNRFGVIVKSN